MREQNACGENCVIISSFNSNGTEGCEVPDLENSTNSILETKCARCPDLIRGAPSH